MLNHNTFDQFNDNLVRVVRAFPHKLSDYREGKCFERTQFGTQVPPGLQLEGTFDSGTRTSEPTSGARKLWQNFSLCSFRPSEESQTAEGILLSQDSQNIVQFSIK